MEILLISDTHGNTQMIDDMLNYAQKVDLVIHLGDDYRDAIPFLNHQIPTIRIPGTWGQEYQDPMIENRRFETFLNWRFFLTHTPSVDAHDLDQDIDPLKVIKENQCDIFCHGHTHEPKISTQNNLIILNPGHLKQSSDRGFLASFAHLFLTERACRIQLIHQRTGSVFDERLLK